MTVREKVNKEITFGLLIRRSSVRITPGAPYNIKGYEIRPMVLNIRYMGEDDALGYRQGPY